MITGAETAHLAGRPPVILLDGRLPVIEAPAVRALGLREGQVVRPAVDERDGNLRLVLQGHTVELPTALRSLARDGGLWRVQVDARGQWTLQPLGAGPGPAGEAATAPQVPPAEMASRLGQLALRPPLLSALSALMQPGALQSLFQAAPQAEVSGLLSQLLRLLPSASQLSPDTLRRLVRQGGWFQEAGLARGEAGPLDAKALLRLLAKEWTQASAATRSMLDGAVDDIESRQVQAAVDLQAGRELALAMLLPFADVPPVHVRWNRPTPQPGQERPPWVIDLHTRSSEFGEVWMRTRVDGEQVDLTMWAERAELAGWARSAGGELAVWLEDAGLRLAGLQVIHGPRPAAQPSAAPVAAGSLVDVRA